MVSSVWCCQRSFVESYPFVGKEILTGNKRTANIKVRVSVPFIGDLHPVGV